MKWIILMCVDAFFNYLFFWIPLIGLYFIIKWILPKKFKSKIKTWLERPTLYEKHMGLKK